MIETKKFDWQFFQSFMTLILKEFVWLGAFFITLLKKLISIKIISRSFYIVNNQTGEKKFVYVFLDKSAAFVKLFWIKFELCCHIEIIWYVVLNKLFFSTFKIPLNLIKSETVGYFDIIWVSGLINMDFIIGRYIQKMHKKQTQDKRYLIYLCRSSLAITAMCFREYINP